MTYPLSIMGVEDDYVDGPILLQKIATYVAYLLHFFYSSSRFFFSFTNFVISVL